MSRQRKIETVDEVEELLQAAKDETLLQLSIDAHIARGSSAQFIAPDLDRRFQALKSRPKRSTIPNKPGIRSSPTASSASHDSSGDGDGDLFARFAALKSSLPSNSSSAGRVSDQERVKLEDVEDKDEDDEVEKLIKWAIDAARLDPSPPSDTDEDDDDSDNHYNEDEDSTKRKEKRK